MHVELDLVISGDVVERQELLNGTQIVTLEGRSADGKWEMTGLLAWSMRSGEALEGDITLSEQGGAEIFATLVSGAVADAGEGSGAHDFRLDYEIDGGSAAFSEASGSIVGMGAVEGVTFRGGWTIRSVSPDV